MKNLNLEQIKQKQAELHRIPEGKQYEKLMFPLEWLLECGWDKISYDEYLIKYTADTIEPEAKEVFTIIYSEIMRILSKIERMTAGGHINYNYYKALLEAFAGSGLVSMSKQKKIQDRVNKYKKQQELENNSGLDINDIKTV